MKNKEYIRWLKQLDEGLTFDGLVNGKEKVDLHEMIFELCEKLDQEPCEDCIPRNTVLTLINDVKQADGFREYSQYSYLFDQVDNMSSVNPQEPKTGHWKKYKHMIYCSECGASIEVGYLDDMNYCHSCGAKMESEGKE